MAGKLERVVTNAVRTFKNRSRQGSHIVDDAKLNILISLIEELRFSDLNIPSRLVNKRDETLRTTDPVAHFLVFEDMDVTVGVFILKHGAKIPLHDHPGMYGLIRVLQGSLKITSYNLVNPPVDNEPTSSLYYSKPLEVTKTPPVELNSRDGCLLLTPTRNNLHEVVCSAGPAAFLDILSPPYPDLDDAAANSCHYFKEGTGVKSETLKLSQVPCPSSFFCEEC